MAAQLKTKITLYLEANSKTWEAERKNIFLQDDMIDGVSNPYIKEWNVSGLSKPTDEQLASYEDAANTKETLGDILYNRKISYKRWNIQLDQLWHDINDGKLDKTGSWYKAIKAIKDKHPKG